MGHIEDIPGVMVLNMFFYKKTLKRYIEALTPPPPVSQKVTLFRSRFFTELIRLK